MAVRVEEYQAKKVLNVHKHIDGGWFWTRYTAYPYLGCVFGCQYCYCRDKRYCPFKNPDDFGKLVRVKKNAPELLKKELSKVDKDVIGVGDWQPIEKKYRFSRKMLEICLDLGFPVYLLEKSPLVLDDLDLLKKINQKAGAGISFSIITDKDDKTRKIFEPDAPSVKSRFEAMKKISQAGIETGTVMIPVLPFVYDSQENIEAVIKMTKESGGQYVLAGGLTLWGEVKFYYYGVLNKHFPDLVKKYVRIFDNEKAEDDYWQPIARTVSRLCAKYKILDHIPRPLKHLPK
ncbi:MAG: radical SAM protein [Patescibacteria group bacterium]